MTIAVSFEVGVGSLEEVFRLKYGPPEGAGWGPRLRLRWGYYSPDDHYEALLLGLLREDSAWLDVGCGRELFPSNRPLAKILAQRARRLVGVDPDPTLLENPFVHEKVTASMDEYRVDGEFDLLTMRMVAEHVADPERVVGNIAAAVKPGGLCVVYTVNRWSPMPLLTSLTPMWLRHPIKRFLWRTEKKDTFPTHFRMNSRRRLRRLFADAGMTEASFARLDDCRTFGRFRWLLRLELLARKTFRAVGLSYPEQCLLGVYRRETT